MKVEITAPDEFAGSIMGDLNSPARPHPGHGQQGRQDHGRAEVPMAEMLTYGADLTVDDPGPRVLQHGNESLRHRARAAAGKDHRGGQGRAGEEVEEEE